ncbi:MAG: T9SS type A sorting domain-containing protein [Bacteroidetes bacterium]|nr:T9SS type A sorting domain-containing protein [Bacteroidota bacterium]
MKTNLIVFFATLLLLFAGTANAYNYLYVSDPRGWGSIQGTIETAGISVSPKGLYTEVGLYLTFSAKGWYNNQTDTLETVYYFDLPENSVVFDSWLWVDNQIIRGKIMDKWTASSIYENIVKRRRDPSILTKTGSNSYQLRIFPLVANQTRKVKLSFLIPAQWSANQVLTSLPMEILNVSRTEIQKLSVITYPSDEWKEPAFSNHPEIKFTEETDEKSDRFFRADLPASYVSGKLTFSVKSPMKNGIYVNHFQNGNEGVYQMAMIPRDALQIYQPVKIAVLIDYTASNSSLNKQDILATVKEALLSNLGTRDSFNLIMSNLNITRVSQTWMPADSGTIGQVFRSLNENSFSNYSNLPVLLSNGIQFVKEKGSDGKVLLVSDDSQNGTYTAGNQLVTDLLKLMDSKIPVSIADYNENYSWQYIGNRYYYGNEYFYTNLSRMTGGSFQKTDYSNPLPKVLSGLFVSLGNFLSSFDLYTDVTGGYCFSRFYLNTQTKSGYLNQPIYEIGKYKGQFPFTAEVSGEFEGQTFSQAISVSEESSGTSDSLSEEIWAGSQIRYLESLNQSNSVVNEIVNLSVTERVLSIYSAFLCLEPSRGGEVCYDCMDESGPLSVDGDTERESADSLIQAYPNPFNNQVNIVISLPAGTDYTQVSGAIYNVLGQQVKTLKLASGQTGSKVKVSWEGADDNGSSVATGVYFLVVELPGKRLTHRLTLVK